MGFKAVCRLAIAIPVLCSIPGWAATFDIADGDVAALIDAIDTANGNGEIDTINLTANGTYTLITANNDTDGPNGLPSVTSEITINGNGATIERSDDAGTESFRIAHVAAAGDLTLNDLTLTNGSPGDAGGGAIYNWGELVLDGCTVVGNQANWDGGGLMIQSGLLTATNSTVRDNTAGYGGGVFMLIGEANLRYCTISDNVAVEEGGGIFSRRDLTLECCAVTGNRAVRGGGIFQRMYLLDAVNCTISGNTATEYYGGGIFADAESDGVSLAYCTISGNTAATDGGGIENRELQSQLKNTIVAGNTAGGEGPDCNAGAPLRSYGHNLIGDMTDCTINEVENPGTDITGEDPLLGPLQDNGGPTETHALLDGSPAIDAGSCTDIAGNDVVEDQRGVARPHRGGCDIGAYEAEPQPAAIEEPSGSTGCGVNHPPVPNAGPDQTVCVGERVFLDGSASYDIDEGIPENVVMREIEPQYVHQRREDLTFRWTIAVLYYAVEGPVLAIPEGANVSATMEDFDAEIGSFVPNVPGVYQFDLFLTDDFGATLSDRVTITVFDCGDTEPPIDESFAFERLLVYPNPFDDRVHFSFVGEGEPKWIRVVVHDLSGKQVWQEEVEGAVEIVWDGTTPAGDRLANGPYVYRLLLMGPEASYVDTGTVFLNR